MPKLLEKFLLLQARYPKLQIVVVDDGSSDETATVAEGFADRMAVTVVRHGKNRGLGCAMKTGLRWVCEHGADGDVVVTMDADDTHDPNHIPSMLDKLDRGADVVIASRYQEGGEQVGLSPLRRVLSWGASTLLGWIFGIDGVRDYSSGYRAYRIGALRRAFDRFGEKFIEASGFQCMAEILLKMRTLNLRFGEVPLVLRYDRKAGQSKMPVLETVLQYFFLARKVSRLEILHEERLG
ncbi:glycosyltransferase [Heliobacterium gestii]|uniref:Glycosyltransferase n=1 Tax=Heliomicrobium gestii TaxID=2699 RepID=A0A845L7M9_HELGE|nr:dolichol-phosphate mannosyltransferase [Heliomicrobium gestii]MZP41591.1 glycosyltransferase [Heliomicrobium gestii]